ncbi:hypothetical protein AVEN_26789-1 [Araneus ventricosus]|uniref:Uncharacterized protein n=1 Tax=Araneus ventricosus TaxID=182803 RepID=A0A4Y2D727_ARAVE|nr:hypothetical protein AVEN_26789-1 [Araneus ventricosus]
MDMGHYNQTSTCGILRQVLTALHTNPSTTIHLIRYSSPAFFGLLGFQAQASTPTSFLSSPFPHSGNPNGVLKIGSQTPFHWFQH